MSSSRGRKLRQLTNKKAVQQRDEISLYHAQRHSFKIQVSLRPTKETAPIISDFFYDNILPDFAQGKARVLKKDDKERQFFCLVSSLWFSSVTKPIRVSLNRNYYSGNKNTSLSTFTIFLINWLHSNGYVHMLEGVSSSNKAQSRWTRICRSKKLKTELLCKLEVWSDTSTIDGKNLIILRNKEKRPIKYDRKRLPKQLANALQEINLCNNQHRVTLPIEKKEQLIITDLHVVFNNRSFDDNGRFYTGGLGYQSLPKADRAELLVDGNRTVELDFRALHPRLLYAMKGIQFIDDPYTIVTDNNDLRSILKKVLLALFNSDDYVDAIRAGNYELMEDNELRAVLKNSGYTIKQLVDLFTKEHEPIADYFCTKQGYSLMNIDSQITRKILEHFMEMGEACLPVHDSYITEARLEQELREIMELSYGKTTQNISPDHKKYRCKIRKN